MRATELADLISECLGLEQTSLRQYSRALREAGLLSEKGRGRGAAQMDALDAAHLLIAVCASPGVIMRCTDAVLRCASLSDDDVTFADALSRIIARPPTKPCAVIFQSRPFFAAKITINGGNFFFASELADLTKDLTLVCTITDEALFTISRALGLGHEERAR